MAITRTRSEILRQIEAVGQQLDSAKLTGPKRLALLRRQAELGDLRDAMAERARRARFAATTR